MIEKENKKEQVIKFHRIAQSWLYLGSCDFTTSKFIMEPGDMIEKKKSRRAGKAI